MSTNSKTLSIETIFKNSVITKFHFYVFGWCLPCLDKKLTCCVDAMENKFYQHGARAYLEARRVQTHTRSTLSTLKYTRKS